MHKIESPPHPDRWVRYRDGGRADGPESFEIPSAAASG